MSEAVPFTSGSFLDDNGPSVCGLCALLVCVFVVVLVMVAHQADEDRGEEHEDEGLKEGDEEFQEGDQHGSDAADDGNAGDDELHDAAVALLGKVAGAEGVLAAAMSERKRWVRTQKVQLCVCG